MYSMVMVMAMSSPAALPAGCFGKCSGSCHGAVACSGYSCSGYSCSGSACSGSRCHGLFSRRSSCSGCTGWAHCSSSRCHGSRCSGSCTGTVVACTGSACTGCNGGHRGLFSCFKRSRCHGCNGCHGYVVACSGSACTGCTGAAPAAAPAAEPKKAEPKPPAASLEAPAKVLVSLPADAKLLIDGHATVSTSSERTFVSPALEVGKEYQYTLTAELVRDGKNVTETKTITVRAGETTAVNF